MAERQNDILTAKLPKEIEEKFEHAARERGVNKHVLASIYNDVETRGFEPRQLVQIYGREAVEAYQTALSNGNSYEELLKNSNDSNNGHI